MSVSDLIASGRRRAPRISGRLWKPQNIQRNSYVSSLIVSLTIYRTLLIVPCCGSARIGEPRNVRGD